MSVDPAGAGGIPWKLEGQKGAPPLVLLNSIGCDMGLWAEALPLLRRRFRLLRIDTRGHGASSAPDGDYTLAGLAADVLGAMDAAALPTAAVAGVSLGGMIAMQMALQAPGRVTSLALICTSASMDREAWAQRVDRVRADGMAGIADLAMERFLSPQFTQMRPDVAAAVRRGLLAMSPAGYAGCAAAIRDMDLAEHLSRIDAPALVVTGTRDISTPLSPHGERLLSGLRGARHLALDCGHLAPLEAAAPLAQGLTDFLCR